MKFKKSFTYQSSKLLCVSYISEAAMSKKKKSNLEAPVELSLLASSDSDGMWSF